MVLVLDVIVVVAEVLTTSVILAVVLVATVAIVARTRILNYVSSAATLLVNRGGVFSPSR